MGREQGIGTPNSAPLLYIERDGFELIGIEEAFASGDIDEQRVAIDSLIAICRVLQRGRQLDNDPRGLEMTKHHIYGGHPNCEQIADDRVSRRFYIDKRNITRIRRDTHTWWEENYGWPVLPPRLDMARFILTSESNISTKDRRACERVIRTETD